VIQAESRAVRQDIIGPLKTEGARSECLEALSRKYGDNAAAEGFSAA
jgi:hypothetical protein